MKTAIKIILSAVVCLVGAASLIGGFAFAKIAKDYYTLDFDNYTTEIMALGETIEESREAYKNSRITYPGFLDMVYSPLDYDIRLMDCYIEVNSPCKEYAMGIAKKYNNNAELNFTVDHTGDLLTIKFTGTGYPENGEPEDLSRTYIFDIGNANYNNLPKLVNRADFIGY